MEADWKIWHNDFRLATYQSRGGDSGGIVYRGSLLIGVHKGTDNEGYKGYSHVTHVNRRLGVNAITW